MTGHPNTLSLSSSPPPPPLLTHYLLHQSSLHHVLDEEESVVKICSFPAVKSWISDPILRAGPPHP